MSASQLADATARLQVTAHDIRQAFVAAGMETEKSAEYDEMIEAKRCKEFLDIAVGYAKSMAFLDHDAMVGLLNHAWSQWLDCVSIELKIVKRKVRGYNTL